MTIKINGVKWRIKYKKMKKLDGYCSYSKRIILLGTHLLKRKNRKRHRETAIHETLHALNSDLRESVVDRNAKTLNKVLERIK